MKCRAVTYRLAFACARNAMSQTLNTCSCGNANLRVRTARDEVPEIGHRKRAAIDISSSIPAGDKHMVGAVPPLDVEVLP